MKHNHWASRTLLSDLSALFLPKISAWRRWGIFKKECASGVNSDLLFGIIFSNLLTVLVPYVLICSNTTAHLDNSQIIWNPVTMWSNHSSLHELLKLEWLAQYVMGCFGLIAAKLNYVRWVIRNRSLCLVVFFFTLWKVGITQKGQAIFHFTPTGAKTRKSPSLNYSKLYNAWHSRRMVIVWSTQSANHWSWQAISNERPWTDMSPDPPWFRLKRWATPREKKKKYRQHCWLPSYDLK